MSGSLGGKVIPKFRETFRVKSKDPLRWFPGHMGKGLQKMQQRLKSVDCVIEVHDARIPISGRYCDFKHCISGLKPHILVLNKVDLADMTRKERILEKLRAEGIQHVLFTNLKDKSCRESGKIMPLAKELIEKSDRFNRWAEEDYAMMIIGAPNVGKSTLINHLRNYILHRKSAAKVGSIAGITRAVMTRIKVSENPPVYLLDTPGILDPQVRDVHSGFKLSLVGCISDHIVGPEIMADYLLFWLNKQRAFSYVRELDLEQPVDNLTELVTILALKLGRTRRIKDIYTKEYIMKPDYRLAANHFLQAFRSGRLGQFCLDTDIL